MRPPRPLFFFHIKSLTKKSGMASLEIDMYSQAMIMPRAIGAEILLGILLVFGFHSVA